VAGPATAAARRSAPAKAAPAARPAARAGAAPPSGAPVRQAPPDDTLRDIYARETAAHVATVRGYLERESQLPEPHPLPEDVYRACHTLSGSSKMAPAPEPAAAGHAPPPPEEEVVDFDPEVAAIFTDEATELIEQSERALTDWRSEPGSAEFRLALKRPLHTLKGGARMAGITPMGDL